MRPDHESSDQLALKSALSNVASSEEKLVREGKDINSYFLPLLVQRTEGKKVWLNLKAKGVFFS